MRLISTGKVIRQIRVVSLHFRRPSDIVNTPNFFSRTQVTERKAREYRIIKRRAISKDSRRRAGEIKSRTPFIEAANNNRSRLGCTRDYELRWRRWNLRRSGENDEGIVRSLHMDAYMHRRRYISSFDSSFIMRLGVRHRFWTFPLAPLIKWFIAFYTVK